MLPILDAYAFAQADESRPHRLRHSWQVTSDSVAVRVAVVVEAPRLILLKSVSLPADTPWEEAARQGIVDPEFAQLVRQTCLEAVVDNLRG